MKKNEGVELRSVSQLPGMRSSFLIEAFNLKGAIEYLSGNCKFNLGAVH